MGAGNWRASLELVTQPDGYERLGYLRVAESGCWEPLNLLGIPLGEAEDREDAVGVVQSQGLASLNRAWWVRAPMPMVDTRVDARSVGEDVDWRRMVVVELTPDRALLRSEIPWPEESSKLLVVELPATDVLLREHPGK